MKILITGASGFIGNHLITRLKSEGHELIALGRNPDAIHAHHNIEAIAWDASSVTHPRTPLPPIDAVIHLAGEPVAGNFRWSDERKKRIFESRVHGTRNLVAWTNALTTPSKLFISTSAIGFYGADRGDEILTEDSARGTGFLSDVCAAWENEAKQSKANRLAIFRIGIVLGREGGILKSILPVFKSGLGGKIGSGKQWMSWIHVEDVVGLIVQALKEEGASGTFNAVAPNPVSNSDFSHALGRALHRPALFSVPAFALKLGLGEMARETALSCQRVFAPRVAILNYPYHFKDLGPALENLVHN